MRRKIFSFFFYITCITFITLVLAGCSSPLSAPAANTAEASGTVTIGNHFTARNTDPQLTLRSNMDALAADGLYYAAWTIGNAKPYENSDGETVDLYDAQLYLLLGEFRDTESAQNNMDLWADAAKTNYEILQEEEITCNGQPYLLFTYNCTNPDNPYERGISAFGACKNSAVCIELACQENFDTDLKEILVSFLNECAFGGD